MKKVLIIIGTVIAIILLNVAIFAGVSNNIVSLEEQIEESSSGIKIQEKRREDLLYNLVDTAKAYAKYENDALTKLAEARSNLNKGNVDEAKTILNAIAENYPKLKASLKEGMQTHIIHYLSLLSSEPDEIHSFLLKHTFLKKSLIINYCNYIMNFLFWQYFFISFYNSIFQF